MVTALPSIATSLAVPPLHLNLAITAYLLSLAVFLPLSGWLADRLGARRVFCMAIALFSLASTLCGLASSLPELVVFRILQGMGGAMMVPVGRLILLRAVPPVIGRMMGPLFGGAIVTFANWRWIFLVNIPFGLLAIALTLAFVRDDPPAVDPVPFDFGGFGLMALGLSLMLGALETAGRAMVPVAVSWLAALLGAVLLWLYTRHGGQRAHPLIDLAILRHRTFRLSVFGGLPLRIAIGAAPFLLPLMLQLGFGLSPLASGMLTMAISVGALGTRVVMAQAIRRFGFRSLLIGAAVLSSLFYLGYSLFTPATPHLLLFVVLMLSGLVTSMCMICLGTLGFSEIPASRMSHATALSTMAQQVSLSFGVVLGAALLGAASFWHGGNGTDLQAGDFSPAFIVLGLVNVLSLWWFVRLDPQEGAQMR